MTEPELSSDNCLDIEFPCVGFGRGIQKMLGNKIYLPVNFIEVTANYKFLVKILDTALELC
jgi:hypothetical protein